MATFEEITNEYMDLTYKIVHTTNEHLNEDDGELERDMEHARQAFEQLKVLHGIMLEDQKINEEKESRIDIKEKNNFDRKENFKTTMMSTAISAAIPAVTGLIMFGLGLKFEETGTVTSTFFKTLINRRIV